MMTSPDIKLEVKELCGRLNKYCRRDDQDKLLKILRKLEGYTMNMKILEETHVGVVLNKSRKYFKNEETKAIAKLLIKKWMKLLKGSKEPLAGLGKGKIETCPEPMEEESGPSSSRPTSCISTSSDFHDTDDPIRLKSRQLLAEALHLDGSSTNFSDLAAKIEICIFEEFKNTETKYKNRVRSRIANFRDAKNPKLKQEVLSGTIAPEQIARMTSDEMASDELKKLKQDMMKQAIIESQAPSGNTSSSNLFKCGRCGERDASYNQVQTLSGDEPMTTFVVCNKCGKRWKFN